MPPQQHWTEGDDLKLRRLRAEGAAWDAIAAELDLPRWMVIERGRRLGARLPPPDHVPKPDLSRPPLAAGHPHSWCLLTDGTPLAGVRYPFRVFPA